MRPRAASRGHPVPTAEPNYSLIAGGEMALPRSTASAHALHSYGELHCPRLHTASPGSHFLASPALPNFTLW
jgi:hypothetical protein